MLGCTFQTNIRYRWQLCLCKSRHSEQSNTPRYKEYLLDDISINKLEWIEVSNPCVASNSCKSVDTTCFLICDLLG